MYLNALHLCNILSIIC